MRPRSAPGDGVVANGLAGLGGIGAPVVDTEVNILDGVTRDQNVLGVLRVDSPVAILDDEAIEFLTAREVSIGLSLDAPTAAISDRTRVTWDGRGVHQHVLDAMDRLKGYHGWSVICTVSSENMRHPTQLANFCHAR